jgi:metal-sulfur cluster biosynthetic enzyme
MAEEGQKLIWEADSTHPAEAEIIRSSLREVMDPELGMNIIELGLIRDLNLDDDTAHVKMIMTTPFCPYAPALLEMARAKVEEACEKITTIELGMDPWDPSMMEEGAGGDWGLF